MIMNLILSTEFHPSSWSYLFMGIGALACLYVLYKLFIAIPIHMARSRGRDAVAWVILSFVISPIFVILLLLILGDKK